VTQPSTPQDSPPPVPTRPGRLVWNAMPERLLYAGSSAPPGLLSNVGRDQDSGTPLPVGWRRPSMWLARDRSSLSIPSSRFCTRQVELR